jgi:hypothetical protein
MKYIMGFFDFYSVAARLMFNEMVASAVVNTNIRLALNTISYIVCTVTVK